MVSAVTGVYNGQKVKKFARVRNDRATIFRGAPHLPKFHRRFGRASPRQRLSKMQEIDIMYDERRAATVSEIIALNATELPMLIRESRQFTMNETRIALRGTSQPGLTYFSFRDWQIVDITHLIASTYVTEERTEGNASIAREGEQLARSAGRGINSGTDHRDYDEDCHGCSSSMGTCGAQKNLNVRLS